MHRAETVELPGAARPGPRGLREALRARFDTEAILEIVAVIALFGFLNRWNDTLATPLEDEPLAVARARLAGHGWRPRPHAGGGREEA